MDNTVQERERTYTIAYSGTESLHTQQEEPSQRCSTVTVTATEFADPTQPSFVDSLLTQTTAQNDSGRSREDQVETVAEPHYEPEGAQRVNALVAGSVQRLVEKHNIGQRWKDGWADLFRTILSRTERMPEVMIESVRAYRGVVVVAYEEQLAVVAECTLDELLDVRSSVGDGEAAQYLWCTEQVLSAYCVSNADFMATFVPKDAGPLHRSRTNIVAWLDEVADTPDLLDAVAEATTDED